MRRHAAEHRTRGNGGDFMTTGMTRSDRFAAAMAGETVPAMNILLIPGFMLDADLWRDVRSALECFGRILDVDTSQDSRIEAMADRAIAGLTEPSVVIGFSMGGYVAREIAYRAPDNVRSLALIATSARGDTGPRSERSAVPPHFHKLIRAAVAASLHPDHRTDDLITHVQRMSSRLGDAVFQRQSRIERLGDIHRLKDIKCPAIIIAGADDALRSLAESEELYRGIAGATLRVVEHCGHLIPLEQPDALIDALRAFLEQAATTEASSCPQGCG